MSVLYSVIPVNESITNQEFFDWLASSGLDFPEQFTSGRYPTLSEIKNVLDNLQNCTIRSYIANGFPIQHADISTGETHTEFNIRLKSDDEIWHLGFRGGDYVFVRQVIQEFANMCGTYLITMDGEYPILVFPDQAE